MRKVLQTLIIVVLIAAIAYMVFGFEPILKPIGWNSLKNLKDTYLFADSEIVVNSDVNDTDNNTTGKIDESMQEGQLSVTYDESEICFIGDSRTLGMSLVVDSDVTFICEECMGLDWMKNTAIPLFDKQEGISCCVILLGVNDLTYVDDYLDYFETLDEKYPDVDFAFVSVLPSEGTYGEVNNYKIVDFNIKAANHLPTGWRYINAYDYLLDEGFNTVDRLHYTNESYEFVYNFIMSQLIFE